MRTFKALATLTALGMMMPASGLAPANQRVALVIGNGQYPEAPLANPLNDARAVAAALRKLQFDVVEVDDARREDILAAEERVRTKLNEHPGTALLYYAGHGVQMDWVNYIVPTDAHLASADEAPKRAVSVTSIINDFKRAGSRTTLIILDACRDNPFGAHASGKGLAGMDAPTDTLLAYSTAPGNVASDGAGNHGLYTGYLLDEIAKPGMRIEDLFKRVRLAVRVESQGSQIPWESTSLEEDFYFLPPADAPKRTREGDSAELDAELKAWDEIKDSSGAQGYIAYLEKYPSGFFSEAAQFRLDHLQKPKVVPQSAPQIVSSESPTSTLAATAAPTPAAAVTAPPPAVAAPPPAVATPPPAVTAPPPAVTAPPPAVTAPPPTVTAPPPAVTAPPPAVTAPPPAVTAPPPPPSPVRAGEGTTKTVRIDELASGTNRYKLGDSLVWRITDGYTQTLIRRYRTTVTYADDTKVIFNNGIGVLDQMGNIYKNADGEYRPFVPGPPADAKLGKTWRSAWKANFRGTDEDVYLDSKIVALEEVTVPAGTFLSYKVDATGYSISAQWNNPLHFTYWMDPKTFQHIKYIRRVGPPGSPKRWEIQELMSFDPAPD